MAGPRALIVGLGLSGLALARHLHGCGHELRVTDLRTAEQLEEQIARLPPGVELRLGGHDLSVLDGCDAVFAAPGVAWDSELLEAARGRGISVSSEIDLFFKACPAPIVGITGTNGKTTTTALVGRVLAAGDRPVMVGGNIGETVLDRLAEVTPEHWVVLELSSFQLESIERPKPKIGVILNVTPDHLDRHRTMAAYAAAKLRVVEFQDGTDWAVLNSADAVCQAAAAASAAKVVWFDRHQPDPPMPIPGRHNLLNARAAAAVGRIAGLSDQLIDAAVAAFPGVEHRLELVGEWGGVRWYNDSKATNPDAGRVALTGFEETPLVLIAGGYGSGFELADWVAAIRRSTRAVVLMGASAEALGRELAGHPTRRAASIEEAVRLAAGLAEPGGAVLLSPGYKSFDMFKSYEDRGDQFKAAVRKHHAAG